MQNLEMSRGPALFSNGLTGQIHHAFGLLQGSLQR